MKSNWSEFKTRLATYLWGVAYTALAGLMVFLTQNMELVEKVLQDFNLSWSHLLFSLFVLLLQQAGKWLRNRGYMPLV